MKNRILLSILTATGASLCCITPVLAMVAGTSSFATSFSWLDPLRPYFISSTILILGIAWYNTLKVKKDGDCGCEPIQQTSFLKSRGFLSIVTVVSLLLITFPSYSEFLIRKNHPVAIRQEQSRKRTIELTVNGMTCTSCELHIEGEVRKLRGVSIVKASYANSSTTIVYDEKKVDVNKIIASINKTGYKVQVNDSLSKSSR